MRERFFMLFGQIGMLFEFFFLILFIRNIRLNIDGKYNSFLLVISAVFEALRPLTCLQSFDGI